MTLEEKLNEFKAEGRIEGIAEGKKKKAIEIAKKMLLDGNYSMNQIIESLGFDPFFIIFIQS